MFLPADHATARDAMFAPLPSECDWSEASLSMQKLRAMTTDEVLDACKGVELECGKVLNLHLDSVICDQDVIHATFTAVLEADVENFNDLAWRSLIANLLDLDLDAIQGISVESGSTIVRTEVEVEPDPIVGEGVVVFDDAAGAMSALVTDDGEAMKCFRIPAVAQTGNGTLVAFAEGRTSKKCLDSTSREIMFRRSMDGGKTFGEVAIAAGNSTYPVRVAGPIPSRASLPPRLTPFISET